MYTKGKWENNDGDIVIKVQDNWPLIAIVHYVKTMAETRANACLIAAAPDLLEVCKDVVPYLSNNPSIKDQQVVNDLYRVIKKAEGK